MKKKITGILFRVLISLAAVVMVLYFNREHLRDAVLILRDEVIWWNFWWAVGVYNVGLAIISLRLLYVFKVQNIHFSFRETFYLTWIGLFFNLFLPSAVGGDIAKVYYAYKHCHRKIQATIAVIWDRILGFATLIGMAMVSVLIFNKQLDDAYLDYLVVIFLVFFASLMLLFLSRRFAKPFRFLKRFIPSEKIQKALSEMYHSMHAFRGHKRILLATLALALIGQSFFVLAYYFLALSVGVSLSPWIFLVLVPILSIVSMAPSIGGLGVREAGLIYLFKKFMPDERVLALSLLLDILIYGLSFVAGIIFTLKGGLKSKLIHEMEALSESK